MVLMGRNEETGKQIVDGIRGKGGEAMFLKTDVMDTAVVEQNLQDVLSAYGKVDALLNAAGGNMPGATSARWWRQERARLLISVPWRLSAP